MDADAKTFHDILAGDHRYVVPPYQRPYVWERDRQWAPMWDDIIATVDRLANARRDALHRSLDAASADNTVAPHFLGAVVLEQLPTAAGDIDRRAIVDGQQRITTIQLLIRGILDALPGHDHAATRKQWAYLRKMVRNDEAIIPDRDSIHKLWPRKAERSAFIAAMGEECPPPADSRFAAARAFFAQRTIEWLNDPETATDPFLQDPHDGRVHLLSAVVMKLLKLVVINLESIDDAQVIFEVLNARNTPLTAADLVKNLLFMRAESEHPNSIEHLYETYWKPFDDDGWWTENVGTGHAARPRLDRFLGDFLIAQTGHLVNLGHLYGKARDWVVSGELSVEDVLSRLRHYAKAYRRLQLREEGDLSGQEIRALSNIHILKVVAADPLLLWLLTRSPEELPDNDREEAIRTVEAFLVRRMATKWQTRAYGSVFADVLGEVQRGGGSIKERLAKALAEGPHGYYWPSDEDIRDSFASTRAYGAGGMNQARLRLLLGGADRHLITSNTKSERLAVDYQDLSIEHILPQKWRDHWPIDTETEESREMAAIHRDQLLHRIGNLTLLTHSLNPSVSNGPWERKRKEIAEHSLLPINKWIVEKPSWSEDDIEERSRWLADMVARIWPIPPGAEIGHEKPVDTPDEEELELVHLQLLESGQRSNEGEVVVPLTALNDALHSLGLVTDVEAADSLASEVLQHLIANGRAERHGEDLRVMGAPNPEALDSMS